MTALLTSLIDKQDTSEIVRDQIAAILKVEIANQVTLATATPGKNPRLWNLRVFSERSNPWEFFQDSPGNSDADDNATPIVHVALNDIAATLVMGNLMERQQVDGTFNIDCYGYGRGTTDGASGQLFGDELAAREAQRAVRLVRNILMSGYYMYLGMQGTVAKRWVSSITMFQPQADGQTIQHVVGARLAFTASFNELSPQVEGQTLELVSTQVTRDTATGEILISADYTES